MVENWEGEMERWKKMACQKEMRRESWLERKKD